MIPSRSEVSDWDWLQDHRHQSWPRLLGSLLAARVRSHPGDEVLSVGSRVLDVEEFVTLVASLGCHLANEPSGGPVVVLVDRNLESAVAISAVQWAGRCLIPLSGMEPPDRISDIVERIGSCTIIDATNSMTIRTSGISPVGLSAVRDQWIDPVAVAAEDPAVILFTSGSTGQPKGVVRRGWQQDAGFARFLDIRQESRAAIFGPLQWLGGLQTFLSATVNGYVRLMDPQRSSPAQMFDELNVFRIEHVLAAASLVRLLAQSSDGERKLESVIRVRSQGETLNAGVIQDIRQLCAQPVTIEANYGASELLSVMAKFVLEPTDAIPQGPVPLGTPNLVDTRLEPVDPDNGDVSELVVSRWVADGYWKDPELTASRFGHDENGQPLWRSGDLVRVDPSGDWFFVGRIDDMIKISGKLVEPSEAARALMRLPGVNGAVVLPRRLQRDRQQLVAHLEVQDGVSVDSIHAELARKLPPHLIPAVMMRHEALPVTERGKVDRQGLSDLVVRPWRSSPVVKPRTSLEQLVVAEAEQFLSIDEISVDDDLWRLGLDSLGAIEFSEILARCAGNALSPNEFLGSSTPAELAVILESRMGDHRSICFEFHPEGLRAPIFCVTGAGGMALSFRHLVAEFGPDQPVVVFEQYGRFRGRKRDRTIAAAVGRNLDELLTRQPVGPYVLIGHSWGGLVAHEMAGRLRRNGQAVKLIVLDTSVPGEKPRRKRPPSLRQRTQSWPLHLAKLCYWFSWPILGRAADLSRMGSRSDRFYRFGVRSGRRHRPTTFGGPMLVVEASSPSCAATWHFEPLMRATVVGGDHNSLLQPPHVSGVAEAIRHFLAAQPVSGFQESVAVNE